MPPLFVNVDDGDIAAQSEQLENKIKMFGFGRLHNAPEIRCAFGINNLLCFHFILSKVAKSQLKSCTIKSFLIFS